MAGSGRFQLWMVPAEFALGKFFLLVVLAHGGITGAALVLLWFANLIEAALEAHDIPIPVLHIPVAGLIVGGHEILLNAGGQKPERWRP
jgi:hypothetical protein